MFRCHFIRRLLLSLSVLFCFGMFSRCDCMSNDERIELKNKTKEMFFHAYKSYMKNAFPADELMPLSCKGRYRNSEPSRGDIDDALGNFSLTLIDSLDTLFILNEFDEFERAVLNILDYVSLDTDVDVSVFETNIRVLGGLLGGHIAALELKTSFPSRMTWYDKQLLEMAVDAGNRLLPAFNTTTGLPYPRVNLNLGIGTQRRRETDTCTACAGTMILEFATLSRLTGNPIYERKAARAMSYIWKQRNRFSDLVGTVINIHNGEWVRRESGVGAGIDSYYEYLWKAYGLLGEPVYLHRFQTHYSAVERYLGGFNSRAFPFSFLSVYMHRPSERSRNFMDALQAFWPGLQMNSGDMKAAVALHEMLYQVHRRHKLLPEAFTPDLDVHWAYHLLRPELIESTYLLYQATRDPYYLRVGADILESLDRYARVPCGFAAIKDIRTMEHTDQMDSFVLAETFKYLYLLFSEPSELPLDMNKYILSTEAHLLPTGLPPVKSVPGTLSTSQQQDTTTNVSATSDFYIERDEQAEQLLHRTAQCMRPFAYGEELEAARGGHCPRSVRAAGSVDAGAVCLPDEGEGLPRLEATFRRLMGLAPSSWSSCSSSSDISRSQEEALLWSRIEAIRRPLRKIASVMLARKNGSGAKQDSQQQQQPTATRTPEPLISASEFRPDNLTHLQLIRRMGIVITPTLDGKLQLHLDQAQAETPLMGLLGITFLEQIIQMNQATPISEPSSGFLTHTVAVLHPPYYGRLKFQAGPSRFGLYPGEEALSSRAGTQTPVEEAEGADWPDDLTTEVQEERASAEAEVSSRPRTAWRPLAGPLVIVEPYDACSTVRNSGLYAPVPSERAGNSTAPQSEGPVETGEQLTDTDSDAYRGPVAGAIALVTRGGCMFLDKARNLKEAGAVGGIIIDNTAGTSAAKHQLFSMSGDAPDDHSNGTLINLPFVFLFNEEGETLRAAMTQRWRTSQQPAIGLISKEDDSPRIFSHALKALDTSSEAEGDTCYDVLTTLKKEEAPTVCHSSRFFVSALVPEDTQESGWQLSLLPDAVEEGHLVFKVEDGDQYYSKDPTAWSTLIDRQWPVSENTSDCKDLILAMIEAVLSHTTDRESSFASNSPVVVSQNWISRINDCLLPMSVLQSASGNTDEGVKSKESTGWSGEIVHAYNLLTRLFCLQFVFLVISFLVFLFACHLFIPNTHFEHEVRLRHERPLKHRQLFAKADLDLSLKGASAFTAGQAYRVDFHLVVPESPSNRDAGMSLVDLILFSENGTATARLSNSFLPDHQPSIIDLMDTLMFSPFYLFRVWRKEQKLVIRLREAFVDNWELPSMRAEVHLTADHLHWYSSRLVVHAVFNPLTKILNSHTWVFCLVFMLAEMLLFNFLLFCFLVIRYHKTVFVACVAFLSKLVPGGTGPNKASVSTQTTDQEKETEKEDQEDHDELPESVGEPHAALTLSTIAETQRAEDDDSPVLILGTDSSSDSF